MIDVLEKKCDRKGIPNRPANKPIDHREELVTQCDNLRRAHVEAKPSVRGGQLGQHATVGHLRVV